MEQCSPLPWLRYAELQRLVAQTTAELEATVAAAQAEISKKDEEVFHMRNALAAAFKERDEAHCRFQKLLIENLSLRQMLQAPASVSVTEAGAAEGGNVKIITNAASFSSSDSEDSVISEVLNPRCLTPSSPALPPLLVATLGKERALPEKGKLLQAVVEAGPTLETLLVSGQLPQWQKPPPQLNITDIPPVTIPPSPMQSVQPKLLAHQESNGNLVNNKNKKRALS